MPKYVVHLQLRCEQVKIFLFDYKKLANGDFKKVYKMENVISKVLILFAVLGFCCELIILGEGIVSS